MQHKPIHVLYISYDGMTDPLGQSQVIPYLEGLSKQGYVFTLLSFEKQERFALHKDEIATRLKQSHIDWVPLSYTKSPPVLSTLWDVWRMKRKAVELYHQKHFAIVHCRSYIASLVGVELKKSFGIKFVFDMRGFYADERVDGGLWKLNNPVYRWVHDYFKRREKEFLAAADYTISLTHKGKEIIHQWQQVKNQPVPIEVIPCCANLDLFSSAGINPEFLAAAKTKFNIQPGEFILSYLGSLGTWYMPDEMMDFFYQLLQQRPDARFLFITQDTKASVVARAAKKNIPPDKIIVAHAKHHEVPAYLALSTAALFFIKPVFSKKASSPTKQGEIMGLGIPQVCNSGVGDVDEITDEKCGVLVHQFTAAEYKNAIATLLATTYQPGYIRQKAEDIYALQQGVARYKKVYESIMAGKA
jgi:glycosyltransferase involved in cell wall biosynthesis